MSSTSALSGGSIAIQLAMLQENRHISELAAARDDVQQASKEQQYRREQQIEAEEKAREEADDSSFWSNVGGIAKDVAAAGCIAGAAFSGGSTLIVGAAILGGSLTIAGDVGQRTGIIENPELAAGLELAGAAFSLAGGGASLFVASPSTLTQTAALGKLVGGAVAGGGTTVAGAAIYKEKSASARETDARAEAREAEVRAETAGDRRQDTIDRAEQGMRDRTTTAGIERKMQRADHQTTAQLMRAMRG